MSSSADIQTLMDMGFGMEKAEKALSVTGNVGVEPAMEWLLAHGDEMENSVSATTASGDQNSGSSGSATQVTDTDTNAGSSADTADENQVAKSLKCNECGKLFKSQLEVEFHATKSGHADFSESTEEKRPLTEEERAEQRRLIEEKMRLKRIEREEREKQEAVDRERDRIRSGKEIAAARRKLEDEEIRKMVELRRREKEEDRLARERVKLQIEQDRRERKEREGGAGVVDPPTSPSAPPTNSNTAVPTQPPPLAKDYSQTRLQIRLTNGEAMTHTFCAKEQLSAVRLFIELNRKDVQSQPSRPFSLMTSFPRKVFTDDDYDKPLDILGLVPSAVIIVVNKS